MRQLYDELTARFCPEIESKPASVHLFCMSETGCCQAAGRARHRSQASLKYESLPLDGSIRRNFSVLKYTHHLFISAHRHLVLAWVTSSLASRFTILKEIMYCRYGSMYIQRKEPLGYVITFLNCLEPFTDIISVKFSFWGGSKPLEVLLFYCYYIYAHNFFRYLNFQSLYLFCFYCQIMDANLNTHIMHADIRDTKTGTASLKQKNILRLESQTFSRI